MRIDTAMSEAQRDALLEQVTGYLQRKVLKRPTSEGRGKSKSVSNDASSGAEERRQEAN